MAVICIMSHPPIYRLLAILITLLLIIHYVQYKIIIDFFMLCLVMFVNAMLLRAVTKIGTVTRGRVLGIVGTCELEHGIRDVGTRNRDAGSGTQGHQITEKIIIIKKWTK